jgi:hypothetical protein
VQRLSISSMKMMLGEQQRAISNRQRTMRSLSPLRNTPHTTSWVELYPYGVLV